jgi:hypothetical protein
MVPSKVNDVYFLRFAVCARTTEREHVEFAWATILKFANLLLETQQELAHS